MCHLDKTLEVVAPTAAQAMTTQLQYTPSGIANKYLIVTPMKDLTPDASVDAFSDTTAKSFTHQHFHPMYCEPDVYIYTY